MERSQSKGVKLKMREWKIKRWCKLARGIRGKKKHKTDGHETRAGSV